MFDSRSEQRIPLAGMLAALMVCPVLSAPALGQESDPSASESESAVVAERSEAEVAATAMEEVIVQGQRPLRLLLREGEELTADFYGRLNEVLNNDDFRITCENERRPGSNFTVRVCLTGYQSRILSRMAQAQLRNAAAGPAWVQADYAEMLSYQARFEDAILVAVNTDQVLNDQVVRLMALKRAVETFQSPRAQRRAEERAERELDRADEESE